MKVKVLGGALVTVTASAAMLLASCASDSESGQFAVQSGSTWVVDKSTRLKQLTIAQDARVTGLPGRNVTLTVNGVETGIGPETYTGDIVLTPAEENLVKYTFADTTLEHYFRQALYLDETGVVEEKSVLPAAGNYNFNNGVLTGARITSVNENFNGIYVAGGAWTIKDAVIDLTGNGGNDFAGYGAAVMSTGKDTTLILDGTKIKTHGAIRTTVAATGGSNLIVKNSELQAWDGTLSSDYIPNVDPGKMKSVPWMLGLKGNCRATNILGDYTKATYINSSISTENWGVLSNDISLKVTLTAINSKVNVTGESGYGAYSLGGATTLFYGSDLKVRDYGVIVESGGSNVVFGASNPETVARLNSDLKLGLTADELRALPEKKTTVTSDRFGVMMLASPVAPANMNAAPPASIKILDDTVFDTGNAVFLAKGLPAKIAVDGAKGAQLNPRNGVIVQMMDTDDPGVVMVDGAMLNQGVFHEPSGRPAPVKGFDPGVPTDADVHATFANITLKGDFYNAYRDGTSGFAVKGPSGKNLVLTFEKASVTGLISSATLKHAKDVITSADYQQLGEVANTPAAAINNGVIVSLTGSAWTITGTSYLTSLTIGAGSTIAAPEGSRVTMTVNGQATPILAGAYKGKIVLTVTKG